MSSLNPLTDKFIFRPGGGNTRFTEGVPVYSDWAELYTDLQASTMARKTIILDNSITTPVPIPAGTYDLFNVILTNGGVGSVQTHQNRTQVTWATTTVLQNVPRMEGLFFLGSAVGLGTPLAYTQSMSVSCVECAFAQIAGADVLIAVTGGSSVRFIFDRVSFGSGQPTISLSGTDTLEFLLYDTSSISDDCIQGTAGNTIADIDVDPSSSFNVTQGNFGGVVPAFNSAASRVDVDFSAWVNISGGDVQAALNSIDSQLGASGGESLAATLGIGNTTGGLNIIVTNGDLIQGQDNLAGAGFDLNLRAGNAGGAGPVNGGDIYLTPGTESGGGQDGQIYAEGTLNGSGAAIFNGYVELQEYVAIEEGTQPTSLSGSQGVIWVQDFVGAGGNGGYFLGSDGRNTPLNGGWRGMVLHAAQFTGSGSTIGLSQATLFAFSGSQPTAGDTLSITDGSTTRTYGATSGGNVQYTIGGTVPETLTNLAAAITGDGSGLWDAVAVPGFLGNANGGVVIYRATQASGSYNDRLYGTFTVPSVARQWDYGTSADYRQHPGSGSSTDTQVPGVDPGVKSFGFGVRNNIALMDGDTYITAFDARVVRADKVGSTAYWRDIGPVDAVQVVYVCKNGDDNNDGLSPENAKLTVSNANTAASTLTPGPSNQVIIHVLDSGLYTGGSLADYVSLQAPAATVISTLTVGNGTTNKLFAFQPTVSGTINISVGETAWVDVDSVVALSTGISVSGTGYLRVRSMEAQATVSLISVGASGICHAHVDRMKMFANSSVGVNNSGVFKGYVGEVDDNGFLAITCLNNNGTMHIVSNRLAGGVSGGAAINGTGTTHVQIGELSGPILGAGTRLYGGAYRPAAGGNWTNPDPTTIGEAIDRLAAAVASGTSGPIA